MENGHLGFLVYWIKKNMYFSGNFDIFYAIVVFIVAQYLCHVGAEVVVGVARAVPLVDKIISGTAFLQIPLNSRVKCLSECSQRNCSSFNFGNGECNLHSTYLCESQTLVALSGYQYYDVEYGDMIPLADDYRSSPDCVVLGKCSPKCYIGTTQPTTTIPVPTTTTTTTPATTTTATPVPTTTTTTTQVPTTTTTTTPVPTTTTTTTTTPATTTTTPVPTTTTTTTPTTTTTTTPTTTTTTTPAPTTTSAAGPGDVNYACASDDDCTEPFSDCRINNTCQCVAGYSYNPPTRSCVTVCPGAFGDTFSLTPGYYVFGNDYQILDINNTACAIACKNDPTCATYEYDLVLSQCHLSNGSKNDGPWLSDPFYDYFQRNCS